MDLMEMTGAILAYGEICDHCLGRMVGKRSFGLSNDQRGNALRVSYALSHDVPFHPHEGPAGSVRKYSFPLRNGHERS